MGISHPAKNANKLGQVWQNIVVKSDIHGQKENGLELFRSRKHFEEINPAFKSQLSDQHQCSPNDIHTMSRG